MGFGNFRALLSIVILSLLINDKLLAYQEAGTSEFLYQQLDHFLQNPTSSRALRMSKIIDSKKNKLYTKQDQLAWVIIHCNIGYYKNQFGSSSSAILHYEKAWQAFYQNELSDYDIIENCLQPLGNLYIKIGDLPKAETTIKNYLYLAEQSQNIPKILSAIINLSIAYHNQSKYSNALTLLQKGLTIAPNNLDILTNIATNHLGLGNITEAKNIAKKITVLDATQINAYQILASVSLEKKELQDAYNYITIAKTNLLRHKNTNTRSIAKLQLAYTDVLISKLEFEEAKKTIQEIYSALLPAYDKKNEFPMTKDLIADKILLQTLDTHAYINTQLQKPLQAIKVYNIAFKVNALLNNQYPLQETKIIQHSQNRNRTESYIDLLFLLYQSTLNKKYITQAFIATENSKAPFVNQAILSKQVLSQYKNDSLVAKRNQLDQKLTTYETLLLKEKLKKNKANINQIQKWTEAHDIISIELKKNIKELQNKYPELGLSQKEISVSLLQKKLEENQVTLIEYFYGKSNIYQFIIDSNSYEIKRIKNPEVLKKVIKKYIHYYDSPSNITNDPIGFSKEAFNAYKILQLPIYNDRLLIIPDGLLNFIPFEALLTEKVAFTNFQKMPFLIKSTELSYEISANKYVKSTSFNQKKQTVLGTFPVFENTEIELPFSLTESNYIQQYFEGNFIEKEQATYEHFINEAKKHDILHLSTHAESGSFTKPASIKFSNTDIFVNQLYGMQLNSDLVVLSACETGVGKLAKGEGPLSIGRGFQYAGVKNTLFSLWKVNDLTTSKLMRNFYKNLKTSYIKGNALHQAKLDYLNDKNITNAQKSPYHWAAFVYYGEIEANSSSNYVWYGVSIVLFILIILFLRRFPQSRT
ncbi:CHAT domain-containing protein [Aquimarina sp. AU474]|uniref:CHAT domain-containing protein n=1 Tax=Aquimarina sp. AU474 TaxID=2108529 RepID=UPI0013599A58|nr:CHAT domain-containing protein [Aquimarina sp. AU474]